MSKIKIKSSEFNSILKEAISNVMARENTPATQKISLKEIKLIAEKIINETSGYDVYFEPKTLGFGFELNVLPRGRDLADCDYSLIDGSYDPEFRNDIVNWIQNNHDNIISYLKDDEVKSDQETVDDMNEYRPEDHINW